MSLTLIAILSLAPALQDNTLSEEEKTAGWKLLFDGKTLDGWNGDPMFWSVKDGVLHAESTPEKVVGGDEGVKDAGIVALPHAPGQSPVGGQRFAFRQLCGGQNADAAQVVGNSFADIGDCFEISWQDG